MRSATCSFPCCSSRSFLSSCRMRHSMAKYWRSKRYTTRTVEMYSPLTHEQAHVCAPMQHVVLCFLLVPFGAFCSFDNGLGFFLLKSAEEERLLGDEYNDDRIEGVSMQPRTFQPSVLH